MNINGYLVEVEESEKRFFLKSKDEDGKEKSFPVKIWKRIVCLSKNDAQVEISAYTHQGKLFFRDSRDKKSSNSSANVLRELQRMLKIPQNKAIELLGIQ